MEYAHADVLKTYQFQGQENRDGIRPRGLDFRDARGVRPTKVTKLQEVDR